MSHLRTELISHRRKVMSLYKRAYRNLESHFVEWCDFRFEAILLRARFDQNVNELDMRKAKELLRLGEEELVRDQAVFPFIFSESPGGVAYGRTVVRPDSLLDIWHPAEKAQYPDYFARREQRKKEFLEFWEKNYGGAKVTEAAVKPGLTNTYPSGTRP